MRTEKFAYSLTAKDAADLTRQNRSNMFDGERSAISKGIAKSAGEARFYYTYQFPDYVPIDVRDIISDELRAIFYDVCYEEGSKNRIKISWSHI